MNDFASNYSSATLAVVERLAPLLVELGFELAAEQLLELVKGLRLDWRWHGEACNFEAAAGTRLVELGMLAAVNSCQWSVSQLMRSSRTDSGGRTS